MKAPNWLSNATESISASKKCSSEINGARQNEQIFICRDIEIDPSLITRAQSLRPARV